MRIGVLRGRENSFPDAFIAKVNDLGRGVTAEFVQLGATKLNEPVPYRVVLDRMSHEVPYYSVYLKMAALQGTYVINNTFWRSADDKFFGYCAAEKLGIAEPRTVVLPNREYVDDVTSESLRNLWPTDFQYYADHVGLPCIMKPAFGGGWKDVNKIHSLDELHHLLVIIHAYTEQQQREAFAHPLCVPGSDATTLAPDGPLAGSSFHGAYTWAAWYWRFMVREERLLDAAAAIHRLTGAPAARIGLAGRGVLRPGARADVVVLDPDAFEERGTTFEPNRVATGVRDVLVNGVPTLRDGRLTGARAGEVLRR